MTKNYVVAKKNNKGEITFVDYNVEGFKITPKNNIEYPIEVNSMMIIKPSFIEKILKKKIKRKLNLYLNYIIEESGDDDSCREALNNINRYKDIVEYKYRKYLDDKYINLLLKKINLLEKKIKSNLIYKELNVTPSLKGRSR